MSPFARLSTFGAKNNAVKQPFRMKMETRANSNKKISSVLCSSIPSSSFVSTQYGLTTNQGIHSFASFQLNNENNNTESCNNSSNQSNNESNPNRMNSSPISSSQSILGLVIKAIGATIVSQLFNLFIDGT
eukprot:TRINITY_DN5639_c0_g1_i2.p2 TRINITY_DN5639_c0_g1~~TRINITY_DN5639_c0_g1_i2.p2  ORF type:complete len:131 (+),score=44.37 TRINITY_DN5639_c0_g1_i2:71-463(+)